MIIGKRNIRTRNMRMMMMMVVMMMVLRIDVFLEWVHSQRRPCLSYALWWRLESQMGRLVRYPVRGKEFMPCIHPRAIVAQGVVHARVDPLATLGGSARAPPPFVSNRRKVVKNTFTVGVPGPMSVSCRSHRAL